MQTGELIIIAVLALIVLGPTRLPELARKVGRWTAELRQAARDITSGLDAEVAEIREVGKELRGPLDEVKKPFTDIRDELADTRGAYDWKGPKPLSGPTPEDAMRDYEQINRLTEGGTEEPDAHEDSGSEPDDPEADDEKTG
jgi:sec-independent protein translocase protein TatB